MDKAIDFGLTRVSQEGIFVFFFACLLVVVVWGIYQVVIWATKQIDSNINKLIETLMKIETSLNCLSLKNQDFETVLKAKISTLETAISIEKKLDKLYSLTESLVNAAYKQ